REFVTRGDQAMSTSVASLSPLVERGLTNDAVHMVRSSPVHWTARMTNGATHRFWIRLAGDGFLCAGSSEPSSGSAEARNLWRSLTRNAVLPAQMKIAATPAQRLTLSCEVLMTDEANAEQRVRAVIEAFRKVWENQPFSPVDDPECL